MGDERRPLQLLLWKVSNGKKLNYFTKFESAVK